MDTRDLMWLSVVISISLISISLMSPDVTGYSTALGFKGTGMAVFKPIDWEFNSEGYFKLSLENLFGERLTVNRITVTVNDLIASASFNEFMTQGEVKDFVINCLGLTDNEVYEARIRVEFLDRNNELLADQGRLIGVVI